MAPSISANLCGVPCFLFGSPFQRSVAPGHLLPCSLTLGGVPAGPAVGDDHQGDGPHPPQLSPRKSNSWQGLGKMAQQLKAHAATPDDLSLMPGTHMVEGQNPPKSY